LAVQRPAHRRAHPGGVPGHRDPAVLVGGLRDDPRGRERVLPGLHRRKRGATTRAARRVLHAAGGPARRDTRLRCLAHQDGAPAGRSARRRCPCAAGRSDPRPGAAPRRDPRGGTRAAVTEIAAFDARLVRVPLTRPWGADVTSVGVIATHVVCTDGIEGWGFSWTPQIGAVAVLALLQHDIAGFAVGRTAAPEDLWQSAWEHLHEAGGGGITTIALAGRDLALWDATARAAGTSVSGLLGRRRTSVPAYGSGVNLHYSIDDLV